MSLPHTPHRLGALLLLWAAGVGGWSACHDTATGVRDPDVTYEDGDVNLCLQLDITSPEGTTTRTEYDAPGTAAENEVYALTVFLVDVDKQGRDLLTADHRQAATTYINAETDATWSQGRATYHLLTRFVTPSGRKHVYVGANLNTEQIAAFRNGNAPLTYDDTQAATLQALMSHFMTLTNEPFTYTGSRISMFAQALPTDRADSIFEVHASGDPQQPSVYETMRVHLERTVAKVLLACKSATGDGACVEVKDINETARRSTNTATEEATALQAKYRGWAPYATVFYMLNITARAQRLLNDSVATFGNYVRRLQDYDFVAKDDEVYTRRYLSHSADELSFSADGADEYPFVTGALRRRTALWSGDDNDVTYYANGGTSLTRVGAMPTEGIYCLPNRFRFSCWDAGATTGEEAEWYGGTDFRLDSVAQKMATYMVVAVRYVPKTIHCLIDGKVEEKTFESMEAALDTLTPKEGIRVRRADGTWQTYPQETYWAYVYTSGAVDYYTGAAMQHCVDRDGYESWSLARYRCYERGYSYYICFIDPERCDDEGETFYQRNSYDYDVKSHASEVGRRDRIFGLERNHYYVLRSDEISVPGSSTLSGPMCLNAVLVDWKSQGAQDVEVLPGVYDEE